MYRLHSNLFPANVRSGRACLNGGVGAPCSPSHLSGHSDIQIFSQVYYWLSESYFWGCREGRTSGTTGAAGASRLEASQDSDFEP